VILYLDVKLPDGNSLRMPLEQIVCFRGGILRPNSEDFPAKLCDGRSGYVREY
jgi:hypothetical protein